MNRESILLNKKLDKLDRCKTLGSSFSPLQQRLTTMDQHMELSFMFSVNLYIMANAQVLMLKNTYQATLSSFKSSIVVIILYIKI